MTGVFHNLSKTENAMLPLVIAAVYLDILLTCSHGVSKTVVIIALRYALSIIEKVYLMGVDFSKILKNPAERFQEKTK